MSNKIKVVLEGTLFAECEMRGANRDGMMRVAEEIADCLLKYNELDIYFASTLYIEKYDRFLKEFIDRRYPLNTKNIFSKGPFFLTNIFKWRELFRTTLSGINLHSFHKEINQTDIFHSFYYPFNASENRYKIKRSITFHDIIPLRRTGYPKHLIDRTKEIVSCIRNNHAIAVSEFSKQDILDYDKNIDPARISVVPLAASTELFYQNTNTDDKARVKIKYGLPDNYFLCISGNDPRKNIPHILRCFNKFMIREHPKDIHLVLAGNGMHSREILDQLGIDAAVRKKIIIPPTFIDTLDLAPVYSNAIGFLFMSLYEGFGLPALEAMQCGVPTITSNTTSLPEVVGDGGILLSPLDEEALCQVLSQLYNNHDFRKSWSDNALKRAAQFSWQNTAGQYAQKFKEICGGN